MLNIVMSCDEPKEISAEITAEISVSALASVMPTETEIRQESSLKLRSKIFFVKKTLKLNFRISF